MSTVPLVPGYTCRRDGGGREESEGRGWGKSRKHAGVCVCMCVCVSRVMVSSCTIHCI